MRIDQEAFSTEEGNRLYQKLSKVLVDKYQAKPIDDLTTIGWSGDIKVPVSGTPLAVVISLDRKKGGEWLKRWWNSAKIKVGAKRWQKLTWEDGEWSFDQPKLFSKINEEILRVKGEYVAQSVEKLEMETNRRQLAQELSLDESAIVMRTPFAAMIRMTWGNITIAIDPNEPLKYRLDGISLARFGTYRVDRGDLRTLINTLNSIIGDTNE